MEQSTPSPDIKQPFYRLATNSRAAEGTFDISPLLQVLTQENTPLEMARSLDKVYTLLAEYLVSDAHTSGMHYAGLLSDVRRMRDALLQGSGPFGTRKQPANG
ncbi:hypothetical protein CLV24_105156 [Pontibacter ummariensis]|uniref:Uncharacterized protein n=1 Tax=Pontibacter ummariensis TaxID=1610492 RepID=A0A239DTR9_9BACT|nr:hypothetical protein [Pontibacter ummariensis]PRY13786.1 hypothetical protein CLV24_105156 [Pontibacter ummariensis]SNS35133.1 hypothetical protein SAMN06296052_10596 [Pontibacter ummariensis]